MFKTCQICGCDFGCIHLTEVYPATTLRHCSYRVNFPGSLSVKDPRVISHVLLEDHVLADPEDSSVAFVSESNIISCEDCDVWLKCPSHHSVSLWRNPVFSCAVSHCYVDFESFRGHKLLLLCGRTLFHQKLLLKWQWGKIVTE